MKTTNSRNEYKKNPKSYRKPEKHQLTAINVATYVPEFTTGESVHEANCVVDGDFFGGANYYIVFHAFQGADLVPSEQPNGIERTEIDGRRTERLSDRIQCWTDDRPSKRICKQSVKISLEL